MRTVTLSLFVVLALGACQPAATPEPVAPAAEPAPAPANDAPPPPEPAPEASAAMPDASAPPPADQYPAAQAACLDAVAAQTNVDRAQLTVTEVLWAEAGVGVTIEVPGADAPWSCLSDEEGKVQGAAYTGSEGAL